MPVQDRLPGGSLSHPARLPAAEQGVTETTHTIRPSKRKDLIGFIHRFMSWAASHPAHRSSAQLRGRNSFKGWEKEIIG